ncbi:MAG: hypothetical protein ACLTXH_12480 [Enterobacter hormaechei]
MQIVGDHASQSTRSGSPPAWLDRPCRAVLALPAKPARGFGTASATGQLVLQDLLPPFPPRWNWQRWR